MVSITFLGGGEMPASLKLRRFAPLTTHVTVCGEELVAGLGWPMRWLKILSRGCYFSFSVLFSRYWTRLPSPIGVTEGKRGLVQVSKDNWG